MFKVKHFPKYETPMFLLLKKMVVTFSKHAKNLWF